MINRKKVSCSNEELRRAMMSIDISAKLERAYDKYANQSDNPDRDIDYREKVAKIVEDAILSNYPFDIVANAMKKLKDI